MAFTVVYALGTGDLYSGAVPIDLYGPYATGASVAVLGNVGNLALSGKIFVGWRDATNKVYAPGSVFSMGIASVILYSVFSSPPSLSGILPEAIYEENEPQQQNISFVQGDDVNIPVVVWANDQPVSDLNPFTFTGNIVTQTPTGEVLIPFTVSVNAGQLMLGLTALETGALSPGLYAWNLSGLDQNGLKRTFIVGTATVLASE